MPKTVTRERRDCDLNPGPSAPESGTLTTRLPSHPVSHLMTHNQAGPQASHQLTPALELCTHLSRTFVRRLGVSLADAVDDRPSLLGGGGVRGRWSREVVELVGRRQRARPGPGRTPAAAAADQGDGGGRDGGEEENHSHGDAERDEPGWCGRVAVVGSGQTRRAIARRFQLVFALRTHHFILQLTTHGLMSHYLKYSH